VTEINVLRIQTQTQELQNASLKTQADAPFCFQKYSPSYHQGRKKSQTVSGKLLLSKTFIFPFQLIGGVISGDQNLLE
jgi:hypothetical protein